MARANGSSNDGFEAFHVTVRDGMRLYARKYPAARSSGRRAVLCLAGLTRNSRDFHDVALALAHDETAPRDVYALDMRGRGGSGFDADWKNYTVPHEMQDALDFLVARELHDVAVLGTSRGGLIAMVMAAVQPGMIGCAVLNDIGPVIEMEGLTRIAGYAGRTPAPADWRDAARIVKELNARQFPGLGEDDWLRIARQFFNETNGQPVPGYDPQVCRSISVMEGPMPELWPQFEAMKAMPLMVLRGENSDILSAATVAEMERRHPQLTSYVAPREGHAPLLHDEASQAAIAHFLARCDRA